MFSDKIHHTLLQISITKNTDLSQHEIKRRFKEGMVCDACMVKVDLIPDMKCSCGDSRPLNVFMVDMDVSYLKSTSKKKTYDLEIEFHPPDAEREEKYEGEIKPFDFSKIYAPLGPVDQRKVCGLPPRGKSHAVGYDDQRGEDEEENRGSYNG